MIVAGSIAAAIVDRRGDPSPIARAPDGHCHGRCRGTRYPRFVALSRTEEIGRVLADRYRIIAPIGRGASAHVFLADDVRLRRRVAVKMLHDALADDGVHVAHTAIGGRIAPGEDHEPDDVAEVLWRHHAERGDFQVRLGINE